MITKTTTNYQITNVTIDHSSEIGMVQLPCELTITIDGDGVPANLLLTDSQSEKLFHELLELYGRAES